MIHDPEAHARKRLQALAQKIAPEKHIKLLLPPKAKEIVIQATIQYGIPSGVIFARTRNMLLVKVRNEIYQKMKDSGYTIAHIGRMCQRDHTTVLYSLRRAA